MAEHIIEFGLAHRSMEKQEARDRDDAAIGSGRSDMEIIARRNNMFSALDLRKFEIVAIGKRKIATDAG